MNWLGIIIGIIFLIGLIMGIVKGAIKILVSLLVSIVTFVLVFFATPYVVQGITSVTPLQDVVEHKIEAIIDNIIAGDEAEDEELVEENTYMELEDEEGEDVAEPVETLTREEQVAFLKEADMPNAFRSILLTNNNSAIYEKLGVTTFYEYVPKYLAKVVVNIIAFLITLTVVTILLRAVIFALNVIADLPVFGIVNRLAGGALGLVGSLIIVWVIFIVVTLLYTTSIGQEMYAMIQSNSILSMIYEMNPVMILATILRG